MLKALNLRLPAQQPQSDSVKLTKLITDDKGRIPGNLYPAK